MNFSTIQITEVLWLIAALPGLWLWVRNRSVAIKDYRAARQLNAGASALRWAKFEVNLTATFSVIEALFIGIGILAMTQPISPVQAEIVRWASSLVLTGISVGITVLGNRWRVVHQALIEQARGMVGATGATGAAGPAGETGHIGTRGRAGARGQVGAAGEAGVAGEMGAAGEVGAAGEAGAAGTPGAAGSVGSRGSTGSTGVTGAAGAPGARGTAGREPTMEEIAEAVRKYMDARASEQSEGK